MNDSELRAQLRMADPAASITPLPPDQLSRLMEDTMTQTTTTKSTLPRWRVLAAAAAVLAVAGAGWLLGQPQQTQPQAPATPAAAIRLTAGSQLAKCRPPEASILDGSADFAFAGKVAEISGTEVTFTVTKVFRGAQTQRVQVSVDGSSESLMGGGVSVGGSYLISSAQGGLLGCGYSGTADTPGLAELFAQAFRN